MENLASPHLLSPQPGNTLLCMCFFVRVCVMFVLIYYDALTHTLACLGVSSISSGMHEGEEGMSGLLQYVLAVATHTD